MAGEATQAAGEVDFMAAVAEASTVADPSVVAGTLAEEATIPVADIIRAHIAAADPQALRAPAAAIMAILEVMPGITHSTMPGIPTA